MTHNCRIYHYGNQELIRQCCVEYALECKAIAVKVALTRYHPAVQRFTDAWNSLTDAEMALVKDDLYKHGLV